MVELSFINELILLFAAFFAGFIDAISGGGGLVIIPLLLAFGFMEQVSIATHKFQAMFAMLCSFLTLFKHIEFKRIIIGIIFSIFGGILGARVLLMMDPEPLKPIIFFTLIFIFIYTLFNSKLGNTNTTARMNDRYFYPLFGLLIGFYDGFLGPGTGSFWIFTSISLLGENIKQASINAKALCMASGSISLIIFLFEGNIFLTLGIKMAIFGIVGAYFGAKFILKYKSYWIRRIFIFIVLITLIKLGLEYFNFLA